MKVLFNWLKEFVPLEISAQQAAEALSKLGFEIATVQPLDGGLRGVVSAEVQDVHKHPNADRLSLCTVTDGQTQFSVVCGAPNVRPGIRVPLAKVGSVLPKGQVIGAAKIRGVDSQGMICSAAELGLTDAADGILILEPETPLGMDVRPLLGLDDTLIEVAVAPNRRDALSVLGIARELSAACNVALKNPEPRVRELDLTQPITIYNDAPTLCHRYIGRFIREVRVGPSPSWMVQRLARCGIRSINNIVDITNYVMLELGQPMHAFDAGKLQGRTIRIRTAQERETLLTLEGKTVQLQKDMLIIADQEKPVALAGIIGGEESAMTSKTQDVLLESAAFLPSAIRHASKALGVSSESSYRFERGYDWNMVATASMRAAQLIQEHAGGVGHKAIETHSRPPMVPSIKLRTQRVRQFLGLEIKDAMTADLLRRLGCTINTGTEQLLVNVPSWRLDLMTEADLMEEIARLQGYENIPARSPTIRLTTVPNDPFWMQERRLAHLLIGLGLSEVYNYSFTGASETDFFVPGLGQSSDAKPIPLANPLSQEFALLRTSLLPGLLQSAIANFHRQTRGVRFFEIGRVFYQTKESCQEARRLGVLLGGEIQPPHWRQKTRKADFYELSGLLAAFLEALHIPHVQWTAINVPPFHPKRSAAFFSGNMVLGWAGELHPKLQERLDTREPLVAAELEIQALIQSLPKTLTYQAPSIFPPIDRDLSVVVPESISYETVLKALRAAAGNVLESCSLIDLFRGPTIGAERKSMTLSFLFRHHERTLTDPDVEKVMSKILQELQKKYNAELRQ